MIVAGVVAGRPEEQKRELIERACTLTEGKLPEPALSRLQGFITRYFQGAAAEDLLGRSAQDLYAIAFAHWNFLQTRVPGEPHIHVYNPHYEQQGWQSTHTVVEIVNDDMSFLVDSVRMAVNRLGLTIHLLLHPVMRVVRDAAGRLTDLLPPGAPEEGGQRESLMHLQVDRQTDPAVLAKLRETLLQVLADVRATVSDWEPMRLRLEALLGELDAQPPPLNAGDLSEGRAFLAWMGAGHFTFIGYRHYALAEEQGEEVLRALPGSGLGILRSGEGRDRSESFSALPAPLRRQAHAPELLLINKTSALSTVHRPVPLDYVGVKVFDAAGEVVGEHRFLGLYTSAAYYQVPGAIPMVRRKVARVMVRSGFAPNSYAGKALLNIIHNFPRDELFLASEEELHEMVVGILHLQERRRIRLFLRRDPYGRFCSCLVFVPRDRYDTALRIKMQAILQEALGGTETEFNTHFSESVLARIHFMVHTPVGSAPEVDLHALETRLVEAARNWGDEFQAALVEHFGEERGNHFHGLYMDAFPAGYREIYPAWTAVYDVGHLGRLDEAGPLGMSLYRPLEERAGRLRFKLYHRGTPIPLSDALPVLEHMGLRVVGEIPFQVRPAGGPPLWVHDFVMEAAHGAEPDPELVRSHFQEAFAGVWNGELENDRFNRLVLGARLSGREVALLRGYCKYLLQTGIPFSQAYMEQTLANHPEISRMLVRLFQTRFKPQEKGHGAGRAARLEGLIGEALDAVANLDEDRILRRFLSVIQATLRSNWYRRGPDDRHLPYHAFKLDPTRIPELPLPRPRYEIFVYSPRVEGVHLRGGKVARGGLRWSDRREDFRTEVLGLMKAQMVKNAVIVPVGAKGGFVCKQLPTDGDRDAVQREVVVCYQTFVRGLLDLTDNLVQGQVAPPEGVVRYDDDDPYLVVAADKGTATFSDTANAISREYGFWLGDAFASGGSTGYDHKGIAITARGAWESVKRHFRELGQDIQAHPFTVVGIGDMAGDVFGNGMLLSHQIRLVGAFNHQHIFLDPNPDPEASFRERERLFRLPRSSWADYDRTLLSPGGGIFLRSQKSIPLSPEVRERLGLGAERLAPNDLIGALLRAPVDLLWNGGIGTYVKAAEERNSDVGDRANDALRVNGADLRCRVVGEGGNLGCTQLGRVEYAAAGGRINTDFIDNSGGVDCSDREVNIKVLLNGIVTAGDLTEKQRNALLAEMTGEVAAQVVADNYGQSLSLSLMALHAVDDLAQHSRYLRALEKAGLLDRTLEGLPDEEGLLQRQAAGRGLTRPELAVLFAYGKIELYDQLLASELPDDAVLLPTLAHYFPAPLRERFGERLHDHRLRREIIAAQITNQLVNRMGAFYPYRLRETTGATAAAVARAYVWGSEVFDVESLWHEVEALDGQVPADLQMDLIHNCSWLAERASLWFLRHFRACPDVAATLARFRPAVSAIVAELPRLLVAEERQALRHQARSLAKKGVPASLAERIAGLGQCISALDIVAVAERHGGEVKAVAHLYFHLGDDLEAWWLRRRIAQLPQGNYWQARARAALRDELLRQQAALTGATLALGPVEATTAARLRAWREACGEYLARWQQVLADLKAAPSLDYGMLTVAVQELRDLVNACQPGETPPASPIDG